jgi:hypothetical protein
MAKPFPSKTHIGNHMLHPETLMLNYGYDPQLRYPTVPKDRSRWLPHDRRQQ